MLYPSDLESWWLAAASRATGCPQPDAALACLEPVVAALSDQFTIARPTRFRDYTADPVSLAAYGIFFFPQTFARVRLVLAEAEAGRSAAETCPPPRRILDLGSGTGASTLAAACTLHPAPDALTAVDHAPAALETLRRLFTDCRTLWPQATLETRSDDARADGETGPFDLILASFVLNELFPDAEDPHAEAWMRRQLARLAPGGTFVVIEPAGAATCGRLQRLRDRFAQEADLTIVAPCPHRRPCPLPAAHCGFCHDVRSWRVPDSVSLVNRRLFRSVQDLKYGLLVLQRTPATGVVADDTRCRLVAPLHRAKGRLVTRGCCGDGTLREIELPTRGLNHAKIDALCAHDRGARLRLVNPRLLGDGRTWRAESLEPIETITQ